MTVQAFIMNRNTFWDVTGKILLVLALLIGMISLSMNLLSLQLEKRNPQNSGGVNYYLPEENSSVIRILGTGMIDYGLYAPQIQDYSECFEDLHDLISNYEVSVCTQRTLVGTQVPAAFAENVRKIGFDAVGLATPNAMTNGKKGVDDSLVFWDAQQLQQAGNYWSTDQQNLIRPFEINGISVVFLSYTDYLDDPLPEQEKYLVNVYDDEKTPLFVEQAADVADVVVVSICWKGSDGEAPNERQKTIAKALADAGASVILGNAYNAVQPVAWIDDTLVFYSMGNVLCDGAPGQNRLGLAGVVTVTKTTLYDKKKIELTNPRVDVFCSVESEDGQYVSRPVSSLSDDQLEDHEAVYENCRRIIQSMDDSIRVGGLQ